MATGKPESSVPSAAPGKAGAATPANGELPRRRAGISTLVAVGKDLASKMRAAMGACGSVAVPGVPSAGVPVMGGVVGLAEAVCGVLSGSP